MQHLLTKQNKELKIDKIADKGTDLISYDLLGFSFAANADTNLIAFPQKEDFSLFCKNKKLTPVNLNELDECLLYDLTCSCCIQ